MREKHLKEDLADLAYKAESDHEVQMARAELYKIAKYAIKMHEMLKGVDEQEGLEGWVQSKITKAADYMGSVYHHMDYQVKFDEVAEAKKSKPDYIDIDGDGDKKEPMKKAVKDKKEKVKEAVEMCPEACCGKPVTECKCGPDCEHCDCYEKNKATNEGKYKNDAQRKAVHASKADKKKKESYVSNLESMLESKLAETLNTCSECGKEKLTKTEMAEIADLEEGKKHGNSKVYDKCWKGCRKVAGKKRGEPGSCKCD